MGWSTLIDIADGIFGFSKEERRRKIKNKLAELERKRDEIIEKPADAVNARKFRDIVDAIGVLEAKLKNEI